MTFPRKPRPSEVALAARDPRLLAARIADPTADPYWREQGRCRDVDPDLFFPSQEDTTNPAIRICGRCDVQALCLRAALTASGKKPSHAVVGVWGATTERERRAMLPTWNDTDGQAAIAS